MHADCYRYLVVSYIRYSIVGLVFLTLYEDKKGKRGGNADECHDYRVSPIKTALGLSAIQSMPGAPCGALNWLWGFALEEGVYALEGVVFFLLRAPVGVSGV